MPNQINPVLHALLSDYDNSASHLLLLHMMVRERAAWKDPFIAVELGVNGGGSSVAMVTALTVAKSAKLFSCDIEPCEYAKDRVTRTGCDWLWEFHICSSTEFHERVPRPDFVFLDTSHERDQTEKELAIWSDHLNPGGRLVLHDTMSRPEGVLVPFRDFWKSHPDWGCYNIDVDCGLGVAIKP